MLPVDLPVASDWPLSETGSWSSWVSGLNHCNYPYVCKTALTIGLPLPNECTKINSCSCSNSLFPVAVPKDPFHSQPCALPSFSPTVCLDMTNQHCKLWNINPPTPVKFLYPSLWKYHTLTRVRYSTAAERRVVDHFLTDSSHTQQWTPLRPEYTQSRCLIPKSSGGAGGKEQKAQTKHVL